jgi:lipoate-protein ligase A
MNSIAWRVIDTGLRGAAENLALNRAMLEARQHDEIPSTLRFLRFRPCALLGYHQAAEQELNLEYCARQGIEIQRRITGGGAIYFDPGQLGWELYLTRENVSGLDMQGIARRICEAAAHGISTLGVDARFRPRNDIEVNGRKVSGTGGAFDGDALMYQGTLLIEFDIEKMLRVLRIPAEKLSDKAIASARERVVALRELLAAVPALDTVKHAITRAFSDAFQVEFAPGELS